MIPPADRLRLMALTVTNANLDGIPTGLRAVDGVIDTIGPDVRAEPGDETVDAARRRAACRRSSTVTPTPR